MSVRLSFYRVCPLCDTKTLSARTKGICRECREKITEATRWRYFVGLAWKKETLKYPYFKMKVGGTQI